VSATVECEQRRGWCEKSGEKGRDIGVGISGNSREGRRRKAEERARRREMKGHSLTVTASGASPRPRTLRSPEQRPTSCTVPLRACGSPTLSLRTCSRPSPKRSSTLSTATPSAAGARSSTSCKLELSEPS
jgi:hypothetical protein